MIDEVSIVIPTLNEERYLPYLLESVMRQTYVGKLEVIVVDGGSKDATVQVAWSFSDRIPGLTVLITDANIGHQRNVGAAKAKYCYLLFLDADVLLSPTLISDVIHSVDSRRPFIVSVGHIWGRDKLAERLILPLGLAFVWAARLLGAPPIIGDFLFTTKEQHQKIGGFVEGALLGEDSDYGFRSVKAAARYYYLWRLRVISSDRRFKLMGHMKLQMVWMRGFIHVVRRGPVFPGEGYEYPYGHYELDESKR